MTTLFKFLLIATLGFGVSGCLTESPDMAAAAARADAADARGDAADANARLEAADARVKAADARVNAADARVKAADADVVAAAADTRAANTAVNTPEVALLIPSGTLLKVSLIDSVGTDTSSTGDHFLASLAESVVVDGITVLQKGTNLRGRVLDVEDSGRVKGLASIRLVLTEIVQDGRTVAITTDPFIATADSSTGRDAGIIAGGAGVGAAVGAIVGGKKGAGIGAITGGGAGTGVVLATKGNEIHYGPETRLNFTVRNSIEL